MTEILYCLAIHLLIISNDRANAIKQIQMPLKTTFEQLWYITIATTNRANIIHEINHFANSLRLYMRWTFQ